MPDAPLRIRLFGPPEFRVNDAPMPRLKTRKGLYVLVLLTFRHGREVDRSWLAGTLWPENDEASALTYLRQSLTDLRHSLGDAAPRLLSPTSRTLRLDLDEDEADFITFGECLKRGDSVALEQAVGLYRGPLLEGWTEEWLLNERSACSQAYLGALETLAQQATENNREDTGAASAAVRYLRLIVSADPLRESACRSLMTALATTQDYGAVAQVYRDLRAALRREVDSEPNPETQSLFTQLRAEARRQALSGTSARKGATPKREAAPPREEQRRVSLPRPLSEFIGRVREIETVRRILNNARLVTLTGIGGVGKTRLSIRVAEEAADDFADGVRFVDLSPLSDPALVARTAANALGISEQPGRPLLDSLSEGLKERQLLLVLDNCEHLPEACAHLATVLLQECPSLHILATSRQRLGITGETVRRVPPLMLPDLKDLPEDEKNAAAALRDFESVRLFVDRAQRVSPNLHLDSGMLRSIATICNRLDGIPLALELAAARMSALGPEQIATRLAQRLRLLSSSGAGSGGDRIAPARQRTLRGALDWSHDLLGSEERLLLRRLSIFAGGWALEAAEAICAGKGLDEWEVMDCLTRLVDHSLVIVDNEGNGGVPRYRLLETVREYAQEHLNRTEESEGSTEAAWLRLRHREYFVHQAQEAAPHLNTPEQVVWMERLEREHDNLRAALDGCLEEDTQESILTGLRLAVDLQLFWPRHGSVNEGYRILQVLLERDTAGETVERAQALVAAGSLCYRMAQYPIGQQMLEEALAIYQKRGDRLATGIPIGVLGSIAMALGDYPQAKELMEQSLALVRERGDRHGEGMRLLNLGNVARFQGHAAEAEALYQMALKISREIGDLAMEASVANNLGSLIYGLNDYDRALPWVKQGHLLNRQIGDSLQTVYTAFNLAAILLEIGNLESAEDYCREALVLAREMGAGIGRRIVAFILEAMGEVLLKRYTQPERAARLAGASEAQLQAIGVTRNSGEQEHFDGLLNALRTALGDEHLAVYRVEGRALSTDQAMALALE